MIDMGEHLRTKEESYQTLTGVNQWLRWTRFTFVVASLVFILWAAADIVWMHGGFGVVLAATLASLISLAAAFINNLVGARLTRTVHRSFSELDASESLRRKDAAELRSRERQHVALAQLTQRALDGEDLNTVMDEATNLVCRTLEVTYCDVLQFVDEDRALIVRACVGDTDDIVGEKIIDIKAVSYADFVQESMEPVVIEDLNTETRFRPPMLLVDREIVSGASAMIPGRDRPFGILSAYTTIGWSFEEEDVQFLGMVADILATAIERDRAVRAQHESDLHLAGVLSIPGDAIVSINEDQNITLVNQAAERVFGYQAEEIIDQPMDTLLPPRFMEAYRADIEALATSPVAVWNMNNRGIILARRKGGEEFPAEVSIAQLRGEKVITIMLRDITERRPLEEQMFQSQKLALVGQLAGGIAHDFNNLLTTIMGSADLAAAVTTADDPLRRDIHSIQEAAERAVTLTRKLLTFTRQEPAEPQVFTLNDLLLDMHNILRRLLEENIELVTLPADGLGQIKADPGQVEQVFFNLSVNARDAMLAGGRMTIAAANVTFTEDHSRRFPEVSPGEYVSFAIRDTGTGMTEEVKSHLFEPLFTTKGAGKGAGMGLSTSYRIIKQTGGHILVDSQVGVGTTVTVYFPRVMAEAATIAQEASREDLPRGWQTILLAEDDPVVRELAARVLRGHGYTVLEAANGVAALEVAREHTRTTIHMLLSDVVMPQMPGIELAKHLRVVQPDLRVLFISGYTDASVIRLGALAPGMAFLPKPFTPVELLRKLQDVLEMEVGEPSP